MQQLMPEDPASIGPYRLSARLGEGGMGQVFLGVSRSGRRLAVKVIRSQIAADPGFRERFRREVAAARSVGGFWTAPIVDADPDGAMPWVASDYIEAPDLSSLVHDRGPLGARELRSLAAGLAEALEAIHRTGLVHRDLKPSNILVTGDGPRVIDFGISKAAEGATTLTDTGLVIGTPGFMSPEQASGGRVGPSSDIFSMGAVLAFAATGDGPFGEGSVPALLYRVVHDEPRLDRVPDGLRGVVAGCLEKAPERRPSASQVLDRLNGDDAEEAAPRPAPAPGPDAVPATATAPLMEVDARQKQDESVPGVSAPDVVEVRAGLVRQRGKAATVWLWGMVIGAFLMLSSLFVEWAGRVWFAAFLALGFVMSMVALRFVLRLPPLQRVVTLTGERLRCRVQDLEWSSPWTDVERITVKPLRNGSGNERQWEVSASLRREVKIPPAFVTGVKNRAAMPLEFDEREDPLPAMRRLDDGLRRFAGKRYARHVALAALLDNGRDRRN
ncbi:serine/threonine-protein kinase [Streptomyces sp. NPDC048357]|uniref:serine/threonine-protein kinase n=1 Tax=Streptomyces sp. NPDC048357 TaxID=3154719 RepID=UPI00343FA670